MGDGQASERVVVIRNRLGLHARPAAEFVKMSSRFESHVSVARDDLEVNGKSIMGVMMLAAECGARLRICARGPDARRAVDALAELVDGGFGESAGRPSGTGPGT
ncbi:MAG: HPr family phosphocarrier protein [Gemmatimonadota bacterium]|nr:HPr family phosphocarrier protein [Gemmatimonadota bacterium]